MKITQWLISLIHTEQREIPDMKDIVTDDMVKNDPRSDTVTTAVKVQIKSTLDQQIDTALVDLLGAEQGRQERDQ
ncbi:DUF826 domain-containing protein [Salmonella enterica subsp. enterica serovar Saintpaul]|uniref:DUF826 domain-containing protein n=1 Tax=Salmonella enterica TaxID=28901 RepID=A0A5V3AUR3_SALER|nr:DUF826 domain-containing protein [Salmonella enterica]EBW7040860.1 hypothetical protein [Salmonella enterica subsp. enterica serovar Bonariensis]EBX0087711.1 hypothetical protein [Salmonella enterica subsp. enterica serovar Miami]EBY2986069.1 hypothetical protein [Salmonella enterica subsp. enterica serovar Durban]ECC8719531.1 hypothetical protein [Salmonella enterica subsp. houtenae]ECT1736783.1 hypothetical protein [Salmonella enterica subsp. enterica serovar Saintpaul]ECT9564584.1 hypot